MIMLSVLFTNFITSEMFLHLLADKKIIIINLDC